MSATRACQECEAEIPVNERRTRCKQCGLLVCGYCAHRIHNGLLERLAPKESE